MNARQKFATALAGAMAFAGVLASGAMADPDAIESAITSTSTTVQGYATATVAAVLAICLIGAGIRIIPKVIRAVSRVVTG